MAITDNLEKMLTSGHDDPMLRFGLGSGYFNEKDFARAIPHLESCIEQNPDYSAAYKLLGRALLEQGELTGAREVFEQGLPIAISQRDKQAEREINSFLNKIRRLDS